MESWNQCSVNSGSSNDHILCILLSYNVSINKVIIVILYSIVSSLPNSFFLKVLLMEIVLLICNNLYFSWYISKNSNPNKNKYYVIN